MNRAHYINGQSQDSKISKVIAVVLTLIVILVFSLMSNMRAYALSTTLDFDEYTTSTFISTTTYAPQGVIFERLGGGMPLVFAAVGFPSVLDDPSGSAFSTPSMLCGNDPANVGIRATFVDPSTQVLTPTNYVKVNVSSGPGPDLLSSNVALTAFDADGNVLATDPGNTSLQFDTLTVSASGIA